MRAHETIVGLMVHEANDGQIEPADSGKHPWRLVAILLKGRGHVGEDRYEHIMAMATSLAALISYMEVETELMGRVYRLTIVDTRNA